MTVKDFAYKIRRLAQTHGYQKAARAAGEEMLAKSLIRPYVAYKQHRAKTRLASQRTYLEQLRALDSYTLIVLDAGRYDYLAPILSDFYTGSITPVFSDSRDTFEWISKTWQGEFDDVTYLSGMVPVSDQIPDFDTEDFRRRYNGINPGDSIGEIITLWKTHWDSHLSTVPPETITDVALEYSDRDKLVIHYNQPHSPYIGTPKLLGHSNNKSALPKRGGPNDQPIWERVRTGDVSEGYLQAAYIGNAVRAIEALEPIIRERDTVIITSDHGEALGEYGMYTHDRAPHPKRRIVPWMDVTGIASTYRVERDMDLNERLEALGYR